MVRTLPPPPEQAGRLAENQLEEMNLNGFRGKKSFRRDAIEKAGLA